MKILLIDDDEQLCATFSRAAGEAGHVVECVYTGGDGETFAGNTPFDLIILDIMLPDKDGFSVCQDLRKAGVTTPILMLTARGTAQEKAQGLNTGADDYLAKPFEYNELFARICALGRRPRQMAPLVIEIDGITIDITAHRVSLKGETVELTANEFRVLELFANNPNVIIERVRIEEYISTTHDKDFKSNVVDVIIKRLREKLGWDPQTGPIQTVRGCGYRLNR
ncbi:two component transcriptional regulator, winged helix family [Dehalogenimonas lykanthroporepellens BL-DC-9]|nr:two component transcriptional regulator, winged helix family [Dehalogenimonas lykanthroporepellens BL-DC-9]